MDTSVLNAFKTAIINRITGAVNTHNSDTSSHSNKQDKSNLTTSWGSILSDTKYPSEKLVKESIDNVKTEIQIIDDEEDVTTDGIYLKITRIPMQLLISFEEYEDNQIGITLPIFTENLIINWGDGTSETVPSSESGGYIDHEYENTDMEYNIQMIGNITALYDDSLLASPYELICLLQVTLPDTLLIIGGGAFDSCSNLTSINIPDSVTEIGYNAFEHCSNLTSINIPDSVTEIGYNAFFDCTSLTNATLGNAITTIGDYAFANCTGLVSVNIPDSVTTICEGAFHGCTSLTSITIPSGVTSMGSNVFDYCTGLISVTSASSISDSAFEYCGNLTQVILLNGVTSIGEYAFGDCTRLTSVIIPNSVTSIGEYAFYSVRSSINDYQLYWEGNAIITYDSDKMPNNTNTIFTIPNGQTSNYVAKGYPSAKLVERSA